MMQRRVAHVDVEKNPNAEDDGGETSKHADEQPDLEGGRRGPFHHLRVGHGKLIGLHCVHHEQRNCSEHLDAQKSVGALGRHSSSLLEGRRAQVVQ